MSPLIKPLLVPILGVMAGLFLGAVIWVSASQPRGVPVELLPVPTAQIVVHVDGAVAEPGVYAIPLGSRVQNAVDIAGGFTETADTARVNLAKLLTDGDQVVVPSIGSQADASFTDSGDTSGQPTLTDGTLININFASLEELDSLPGIGPSTATQIITYRDQNGPFLIVDDLLNVPGIGPATLENIRPYITVD